MSEGSFVDLHRRSDRRNVFLGPPVVAFDRALGCWIVTDHGDCERVLKSNVEVSPYLDGYARLAARLGIDFGNIRFALRHVPLALNGEAHSLARRSMARRLQERIAPLAADLPAMVARRCECLDRENRIDLMTRVVEPLTIDLVSHLTGIEPAAGETFAQASMVFDRFLGVAGRRRVESVMARIRGLIREAGPDIDDEEEGLLLSLFILGRDALAGSFGASLGEIVRENAGRRLSEIEWPALPIETSVAFGERIAGEDMRIGEACIRKGDRVRVYYQGFAYSPERGRQPMKLFGMGAHSCLGKQIAIEVWRALTDRLAEVDRPIDLECLELRDGDTVFLYPRSLVVRLGVHD